MYWKSCCKNQNFRCNLSLGRTPSISHRYVVDAALVGKFRLCGSHGCGCFLTSVIDMFVSLPFFILFIYLYPGVFQDVRDLNAISQVPEYHISFLALL